MKLFIRSARRQCAGNTLFVALFTALIIGSALFTFLRIATNQHQLVARSETWNACLAYAEAGIEEALSHCSYNSSNMVSNGWVLTATNRYAKSNALAGGWYIVTISTNRSFDITSTGYVFMPGTSNAVRRTVKITTVDTPAFRAAMLLRDSLQMKGNNVRIDSFDSRNLIKFPLGLYNSANAGDKADVAVSSGKPHSFDINNGDIWGRAIMGPGAMIVNGPNGCIGSVAWQSSPGSGVQPGWSRTDFNLSIPDVVAPFPAGSATGPASGTVDGKSYDWVFGNGNYWMASMSGKAIVTGIAVVYVSGTISPNSLTIKTNAYLRLYGGGATTLANVDNQSNLADHLFYFGLPSNTSLSLDNDWIGLIYAPNTDLSFTGGNDLCGSICAKSVDIKGNFKLHYDEALGSSTNGIHFVITSWTEQ